VISGNGGHGIQIQRTTPSSPTPATGNVVEGNYVGTTATGDAAVANALDGISLVWGAQGNTIAGSVPGAGNVVSGNGRIGISVFDVSAGNVIEGNYIGTNAAGAGALGGNPECGIVLISASNASATTEQRTNLLLARSVARTAWSMSPPYAGPGARAGAIERRRAAVACPSEHRPFVT
jgi:parallel beta-helix repeat protein